MRQFDCKHKQEKVLCAAIWYKNLHVCMDKHNEEDNEILKTQRLPVNCKSGVVFCGHRHLQCMRTMNSIYGLRDVEAGESIQGFLTNFNRFVDRVEGYDIALTAGQIEPKFNRYMFSEDLY